MSGSDWKSLSKERTTEQQSQQRFFLLEKKQKIALFVFVDSDPLWFALLDKRL
jgi:hypothetical protein